MRAMITWQAAVLAGCIVFAVRATAQPAAVAAHTSYTLDDILTSLRRAADEVHFASVDPTANRLLDSLAAVLRAARVTGLSVKELAAISTRNRAALHEVARLNPPAYVALKQQSLADAILGLRQIAATPLTRALTNQASRAHVDSLLAPMEALRASITELAQSANLEKLRHYEVKYGPESPRLNGAEVLLNFAAQWIPPFAGSAEGPSPFEIVTTYSTTGLTAAHNVRDHLVARVVSTTHLGVRHYQFGEDWGTGNVIQRLIKPNHFSLGFMTMSATDAALATPFKGAQRFGGFLDWGSARTAFAGGKNWRIVLGAGKQIIPYLF